MYLLVFQFWGKDEFSEHNQEFYLISIIKKTFLVTMILGFGLFKTSVRIDICIWNMRRKDGNNGLVVRKLVSQSRGAAFKTTGWFQGWLSLLSFGGWSNDFQDFLGAYLKVTCLLIVALQHSKSSSICMKRGHKLFFRCFCGTCHVLIVGFFLICLV